MGGSQKADVPFQGRRYIALYNYSIGICNISGLGILVYDFQTVRVPFWGSRQESE